MSVHQAANCSGEEEEEEEEEEEVGTQQRHAGHGGPGEQKWRLLRAEARVGLF